MNYESLDVTEIIKDPVPFLLTKLASHIKRYLLSISALQIDNSDIVLDASCGHGYGSYLLMQTACKVIGLDVNEQYLHKAKYVFNNKNIKFMTYADFFTNPIGIHVDKIVCIETIEHIKKRNLKSFVNNLCGTLYPGGSMFLAFPLGNNKPHPKNEYHVNEPSIDIIYNLFHPYFTNMDIKIYQKESFGETSNACYITLKNKKE